MYILLWDFTKKFLRIYKLNQNNVGHGVTDVHLHNILEYLTDTCTVPTSLASRLLQTKIREEKT